MQPKFILIVVAIIFPQIALIYALLFASGYDKSSGVLETPQALAAAPLYASCMENHKIDYSNVS
jgi:hypothetical protein